ncbi:MAG: alpha/beta hydrolase [Alphaproteobacteria bacterium]
MMVPPKVRTNLGGRPLDATDVMSKLKIPVLVTHGDKDRNSKLGTAEYTAKTIPGAKLSVYQGIGHAPFYEGRRTVQYRACRVRAHGEPDELITDASSSGAIPKAR